MKEQDKNVIDVEVMDTEEVKGQETPDTAQEQTPPAQEQTQEPKQGFFKRARRWIGSGCKKAAPVVKTVGKGIAWGFGAAGTVLLVAGAAGYGLGRAAGSRACETPEDTKDYCDDEVELEPEQPIETTDDFEVPTQQDVEPETELETV